jgi:transcriptional regulator with XRE-family HTH domain
MSRPRQSAYHNEPPAGSISPHAPTDVVKAEFARRLQAKLVEKGWNQSELARRMAPLLPRSSIARDNISKYIRGKVLPSPHVLEAMSKVLECKPADLLPARGTPSAGAENLPFNFRDIGDGQMWTKVNMAMSEDAALAVRAIVRGRFSMAVNLLQPLAKRENERGD